MFIFICIYLFRVKGEPPNPLTRWTERVAER